MRFIRDQVAQGIKIQVGLLSICFPEYNYNFIMSILKNTKLIILFVFRDNYFDERHSGF